MEDEEIVLESEADAGLVVALTPLAAAPPPPPPPLPMAPGFGPDEWAATLPDGRVVAFLREPVARCHLDRVLVVDGARRFERPLPAWVYYGVEPSSLAVGPRLLVGGPRSAWIIDGDGTMTTLLDEPDGEVVRVAWSDDDTAVAGGWRTVVIDRRGARTTLPCNRASAVCVVRLDGGAPVIVVSDDDGAMFIRDGRVVARDWRPYARAAGDVLVSAAGDGYRVRVSAG